jgi:hypothetical protein
MSKDIQKKLNFLSGIAITFATITTGLVALLYYSNDIGFKKELPRCEYNGWAYADKEIFDSVDSCNTCFCDDGQVVCTEKYCEGSSPEDKGSCTYDGAKFTNGETFISNDGCNSCSCTDGNIVCTQEENCNN